VAPRRLVTALDPERERTIALVRTLPASTTRYRLPALHLLSSGSQVRILPGTPAQQEFFSGPVVSIQRCAKSWATAASNSSSSSTRSHASSANGVAMSSNRAASTFDW